MKSAKSLFSKEANVEVKFQDFLTYLEDGNTERFDIVFFGFSFMLMPNKGKALEVAKRILKPGGKIYAFLTLYEKKNKLLEWIKPKLGQITSIQFGPVMYRKQVNIYHFYTPPDTLNSENCENIKIGSFYHFYPFNYIFRTVSPNY